MSKMILHPDYGLFEREGQAFASSRDVAKTFGKEHRRVLQDVREMKCSDGFRLHNFVQSFYLNEQRKKQPEYLMTRDGFVLLAMGFTGRKAMAFKEAYIERFNEMESFIKNLITIRLEFPAFTAAVQLAHLEPKPYHFSNEINMLYRIIFGMDAKALRASRGVPDGESPRPYLTAWEIKAVEALQRVDIGMLEAIPEFALRKAALERYYAKIKGSRLLPAA